MSDDYTKDDLHKDMEFLRRAGLIEVAGINRDGQWLWKPTDAALNMSSEERLSAIVKADEIGIDDE